MLNAKQYIKLASNRQIDVERARLLIYWLIQLFVALALLVGMNRLLMYVSGYFEVADWNWDMERLLPFSHFNRLDAGLYPWEIKLQRLPGLFPIYPVAYVFNQIWHDQPLMLMRAVTSFFPLLIQSLTIALCFFLFKRRFSLPILCFLVIGAEILLALLLPTYKSYLNAAFRLNWHGDSSLVNILLSLLSLALISSVGQDIAGRIKKLVGLGLLFLFSFLGSISSSLFLLILAFPFALSAFVRLAIRRRSNGFSFSQLHCFLQSLLRDSFSAHSLRSPTFIILLSSVLGCLFLRLFFREGCTPTVVGDPTITRAALSLLFAFDSPLVVLTLSWLLWIVAVCLFIRDSQSFDRSIAVSILILHLSIPLLLFVYVLTSYGDLSVIYRYCGIYAFLLPIALVSVLIRFAPTSVSAKSFYSLPLTFLGAVSISLLTQPLTTVRPYQNPLHNSLVSTFDSLGYKYDSRASTVPDVLVTDGIGNMATAPVLEFLAGGSIRYSQLAAVVDPRLFDQSPEEYLLNASRHRLHSADLLSADVRDYRLIVSTSRVAPEQIDVLGPPTCFIPLGVKNGPHEYVLLCYESPRNVSIKKYIASYLNRHQDISCNGGVSWFEAAKNLVF